MIAPFEASHIRAAGVDYGDGVISRGSEEQMWLAGMRIGACRVRGHMSGDHRPPSSWQGRCMERRGVALSFSLSEKGKEKIKSCTALHCTARPTSFLLILAFLSVSLLLLHLSTLVWKKSTAMIKGMHATALLQQHHQQIHVTMRQHPLN